MAPHKNRIKTETASERVMRLRQTKQALFEFVNMLQSKLLFARSKNTITETEFVRLDHVRRRVEHLLTLRKAEARFSLGHRLRLATRLAGMLDDALSGRLVISGNDLAVAHHKRSGMPLIRKVKAEQNKLDSASRDFWRSEQTRLLESGKLDWMKA